MLLLAPLVGAPATDSPDSRNPPPLGHGLVAGLAGGIAAAAVPISGVALGALVLWLESKAATGTVLGLALGIALPAILLANFVTGSGVAVATADRRALVQGPAIALAAVAPVLAWIPLAMAVALVRLGRPATRFEELLPPAIDDASVLVRLIVAFGLLRALLWWRLGPAVARARRRGGWTLVACLVLLGPNPLTEAAAYAWARAWWLERRAATWRS